MLKVIELFAGIGSQTQALKNIGIEHKVVAISEIDKYAIQSYTALHGQRDAAPINNLGDITKIKELPPADLWTYSFPCVDISISGAQRGFSKGSGTRSGLLWEVERLLLKAREKQQLPKYLLLENVKHIISKKFKGDFDSWLAFLTALGYANYWQVLNAKHYGIPQNRERVFCVSILGAHQPYQFPEKQELKLRLKDMLDDEVDEKFYLKDVVAKAMINSTFRQRRTGIHNGDGIANTLMSRDFKEPQCVEVGSLDGGKWSKMYEQSRRVYGTEGLAPSVQTCNGGNTHPKIIEDFYPNRPPRVFKDTAPTLLTGRSGLKVTIADKKIAAMRGRNPYNPSDRKAGIYTEQRLEINEKGTANALTTVQKDNLVVEKNILSPKRTEYGKQIRKAYEKGEIEESRKNMTELSPRDDGISNTLTTVQKDNLVVEKSFVERGYKEFADKNGYVPEMFNPYNKAEITEVSPTMTSQCGTATSSSSILKIDAEVSRTVRVGGHGDLGRHSWDVIDDNIRIRKLTPIECLRLMGWKDEQIAKISACGVSNTQMYRQAGNGIVLQVLECIFTKLFLNDIKNNNI